MTTLAQTSEIHEVTGDAFSSPHGLADSETTRHFHVESDSHLCRLNPQPPIDALIVSDETDVGGPLVIQSSDPDLNPPRGVIPPGGQCETSI